jgi:hypothetical protein
VRDEATMLRTAGGKAERRTVWQRRSPGGQGGRCGPVRPGQVGEEAARVPGADDGGLAEWRGRGCRRISGGRRRRRTPWGRGRGAPRKAAVGEDDGGGRGGGHNDDDGGGSRTKKWLSAGGGGSLLLYVDTPLVPGRVTNHDKRVVFCHGW